MPEHQCGPTADEVNRALSRGETLGTWERCDECAERERAVLASLNLQPIATSVGERIKAMFGEVAIRFEPPPAPEPPTMAEVFELLNDIRDARRRAERAEMLRRCGLDLNATRRELVYGTRIIPAASLSALDFTNPV